MGGGGEGGQGEDEGLGRKMDKNKLRGKLTGVKSRKEREERKRRPEEVTQGKLGPERSKEEGSSQPKHISTFLRIYFLTKSQLGVVD